MQSGALSAFTGQVTGGRNTTRALSLSLAREHTKRQAINGRQLF